MSPSLLLTAFLLLGLPLSAQSWESLRGLNPQVQMKVQATDGAEYKGRFQSASGDAVSVDTAHGVVSVERARVRRVQVRSTARRVRRVLIASAIGLGIGITVDQTLGAYFRNETGESSGARAATYIAPIAILGAVGGAFPAYRTVYRLP